MASSPTMLRVQRWVLRPAMAGLSQRALVAEHSGSELAWSHLCKLSSLLLLIRRGVQAHLRRPACTQTPAPPAAARASDCATGRTARTVTRRSSRKMPSSPVAQPHPPLHLRLCQHLQGQLQRHPRWPVHSRPTSVAEWPPQPAGRRRASVRLRGYENDCVCGRARRPAAVDGWPCSPCSWPHWCVCWWCVAQRSPVHSVNSHIPALSPPTSPPSRSTLAIVSMLSAVQSTMPLALSLMLSPRLVCVVCE
jgi:hypothetical protein